MTAFVDSSMFFAAADTGDRDHARAAEILRAESGLVTTDHVVVETWLLTNARLGPDRADTWWGAVRGGIALIEATTRLDLESAWFIGQAFPDQDFSVR